MYSGDELLAEGGLEDDCMECCLSKDLWTSVGSSPFLEVFSPLKILFKVSKERWTLWDWFLHLPLWRQSYSSTQSKILSLWPGIVQGTSWVHFWPKRKPHLKDGMFSKGLTIMIWLLMMSSCIKSAAVMKTCSKIPAVMEIHVWFMHNTLLGVLDCYD